MTPATLLLWLLVFLVALALVFVVARALKSWVFELTPSQWVASTVLTFSAGALLISILWGNGEFELLSAVPVALAVVWAIISALRESGRRSTSEEE